MENQIIEKIKNKKLFFVFPILLSVFLTAIIVFLAVDISNKIKEGRYIGRNPESKNTISITATGDVFAKPDLAQISISLVNDAKTVDKAMSENTKKMNTVIDFIKKQEVEDRDLKTANFNISPRYEWRKDGSERILVGYEISQSLDVKIRDLDKIGVIIEGSSANGANQVGSLYFTIDNQDELKSVARQKAIDNAKTKARELTSQLGVNLGRVVNFSEQESFPIIYYGLEKMASGGGAGETPQIKTGENKISVTVTITYEIR